MNQKLPISVCIISGAEATRIGRALESVAGWTSEIIVVLNEEVRDGTEEIALKHGAKVFREPWKGYAAQKNSAAAKGGQEWLLGLDADEAVTPKLREEIAQALAEEERSARHAAFSFPRMSNYLGRWIRHGDWYPDHCVRLWRKGKAQWEGAGLHEKLVVHGSIGKLREDLLHHTFETIDHQTAKALQYADIFAKQYAEEKQAVTMFDLAFRPGWRFLRSYFFRLGFLDGWQGYHIAWMTAFYTMTRYAKAREAQLQSLPEAANAANKTS